MSLTRSDLLFYFEPPRHGLRAYPVGFPTHTRGGEAYALNDEGRFSRYAADVERGRWTEHSGILVPARQRALLLELASTPVSTDSVRFEPANTDWTLTGVGTPTDDGIVPSVIESLPTNGEARQFSSSGGSGDEVRLDQSVGSSTGAKETLSGVIEHVDVNTSQVIVSDDTANYVQIDYDWVNDALTETAGSGFVEVLSESGPNGGKVIRLTGIGTGNNTTGRTIIVKLVKGQANGTAIVHHAQHEEKAFATSPIPFVGAATTRNADQFHFPVGPYRSDAVQAWYLKYVTGTGIGGDQFTALVAHGNNTNPRILLDERPTEGVVRVFYIDTDGNKASPSVDLGNRDDRALVEIVYAIDPSDGTTRIIARRDDGAVSVNSSTPVSWITPTSLGDDNHVVLNERGDLTGFIRGAQSYLALKGVLGSGMTNNPLTGTAADVMDELARTTLSPDYSTVYRLAS